MSTLLKMFAICLIPLIGQSALFAAEPVMVNARFKHYVEPWLMRANFEPVKEGELHMVVDINEDGTVADYIITRAYHESMVKAVNRVVNEWTFYPATKDGEPIPIVIALIFDFSKRGTSLVEGNISEIYLNSITHLHEDVVPVRKFTELDRLPEPLNIVRPVISRDIPEDQRTGEVVVSFFIDETGKVRIPIIEEYHGHRGLADAAYNAILQWKFKPPTVKGDPVIVRVKQPFNFVEIPDEDAA